MGWAEIKAQVEVEVQEARKETLPLMVIDFTMWLHQTIARLGEKQEAPASALLTVEQLATRLQVRPGMLYARVRKGLLPAVKVGRLIRVREEDVTRIRRGPRVKRLIDI